MFRRANEWRLSDVDEVQLADRLRLHVDRLAGLIGPRHIGKPGSMDTTATYIEGQLSQFGCVVKRESYDVDDCQVSNLVVEREGDRRTDEVVIVGAHYDTVFMTPGADDNASAVAMLIEAARLLRDSSFDRTLRFVAFPCEEPPHFFTDSMGSQVYARRCRAKDEKVIGMICLEMVGFYSTAPESQKIPPGIPRFLHWLFPKRGDFLASVGNLRSWRLVWTFHRGFRKAIKFPLFSIPLPELIHEIRLSDNSSFWDQGYRAIMVTDTSFLRNPNYHTSTDTPDTLDYCRMARATIGVAGGIAKLARRRHRIRGQD